MKVLKMGSGFLPRGSHSNAPPSNEYEIDDRTPQFHSCRVDFDFEAPDEGTDPVPSAPKKRVGVSVNMLSKALDGIGDSSLRPWTAPGSNRAQG